MKNIQEKKGWLQLKCKQTKFKYKLLQLHRLAQFGVPPDPQVLKHNISSSVLALSITAQFSLPLLQYYPLKRNITHSLILQVMLL